MTLLGIFAGMVDGVHGEDRFQAGEVENCAQVHGKTIVTRPCENPTFATRE